MLLPIFYLAAPSGGPANLTEVDVNSTHIHLSWDPPSEEDHRGVIRGYNINVTELETQTVFYSETNITEIIIGPLHPYYVYICMIAAVTIDQGPHTSITVITDEAGELLKMYNSLYNMYSTLRLLYSSIRSTTKSSRNGRKFPNSVSIMGTSTA